MPQYEVVARYRIWKALLPALALIGAGLAPFVIMLSDGPAAVFRPSGSSPGLVFGTIVGPFLFLIGLRILAQLMFKSRAAIWMERGEIVHISRYFFRARAADVQSISPVSVPFRGIRLPGIRLTLQSGAEKFLPVWPLADAPDAVIARLKAVCVAEGARI